MSATLSQEGVEAQMAGLKALLTRKNGEIESYKAKLDEASTENSRVVKQLEDRMTALEEENEEERRRSKAMGETVDRLKREKAGVEEAQASSTVVEKQEHKEIIGLRERLAEVEKARDEQENKVLELESEVRPLRQRQQHSQEEEKAKWSEMAKDKATAASSTRKVAELEGKVSDADWNAAHGLCHETSHVLSDAFLTVGGAE